MAELDICGIYYYLEESTANRTVIVFPSAKEAMAFRQSLYRFKAKHERAIVSFGEDVPELCITWNTTSAEDGTVQVRIGLDKPKASVTYTVLMERNEVDANS